MSNIMKKINKKNNPMVEENVELVMSFLLSDKKEDITLCSYNKRIVKDGTHFLMALTSYITKQFFATMGEGEHIATLSELLRKGINNKGIGNFIVAPIDFKINNNKVEHENNQIGFNVGKILVSNYIVYFTGEILCVQDTETQKKYVFFETLDEEEVA